MRRIQLFVRLLSALVTLVACSDATGFHPPGAGSRFLFIGNSLTYVNDVPGMLQALADAGGVGPIDVESIALPDHALVDHWNRGDAQRRIAHGDLAWVVLQQGPSSVAVNRDTLRLFVKKFAAVAAGVGAKTALFAAWPQADRRADFPRAIESYALAANDVNALLLPVSSAWSEAWMLQPGLELYSDGLHANVAGSYLAALVMYARFFGKSPLGLPASFALRDGTPVEIPADIAALLQHAAANVTR